MASGPITSWQIDEETMETVTDFILLGSKITVDGNCSHEIKRHFLLGRKVTTNLDSILKSRDIPSPTNGHLVKAMVFPVFMYGCESWTIKKAAHRTEELVLSNCGGWRRLFEDSLGQLERREIKPLHPKGNQSWILIGRTDAEAETPKLWRPYAKSWLNGKDSDAGKDWGQEEKGQQRMRWLDGIINSMDMSLSKLQETVKRQGSLACCSPWGQEESDTTKWLTATITNRFSVFWGLPLSALIIH